MESITAVDLIEQTSSNKVLLTQNMIEQVAWNKSSLLLTIQMLNFTTIYKDKVLPYNTVCPWYGFSRTNHIFLPYPKVVKMLAALF
jgi:hypothetical protein